MAQNTDTIEAGLARERASLASTLNELSDRTSIESLASDALGVIRSNAAAYTSSIDQAVRANPMALALTGVGLAWLIFGSTKKPEKTPTRRAVSRWEDEGGNLSPREARGYSAYRGPDDDDAWWDRADEERRHASGLLDWIETQARSLRDRASEGLEHVRDYAADRAKVMADFTADLQNAMSHGLDDLSADARERIIAVRKKAYSATLHSGADLRRQSGRLIEDHPMVVGAVALALGAAFASALPRSEFEDRTFGKESDALVGDARDVLRAEREKVAQVASNVMGDLKDVAESGLKTLTEDARDTATKAEKAIKDGLKESSDTNAETGASNPNRSGVASPSASEQHADGCSDAQHKPPKTS